MNQIILATKMAVIEAACGVQALSQLELLDRLEKLYLSGFKAGMELLQEKGEWVAHVIGPDDIVEYPDEISALRAANATNVTLWSLPRDENDPVVVAIVTTKDKL